jgi:hypothetical protein
LVFWAPNFGISFVIHKKKSTFVAKKTPKRMTRIFFLLFSALFSFAFSGLATANRPLTMANDTVQTDTLREVEVRTDTMLRVNEAIRQTIENERKSRIGTKSVSDIIGGKTTDKIMHPFAVKDRKRDKKHARDRKALAEYEELLRVKTFEELLDEAIRRQDLEDAQKADQQSKKK